MRLLAAALLATVVVVVAIVMATAREGAPAGVERAQRAEPAPAAASGDARSEAGVPRPGGPWAGTIAGVVVDAAGAPVAEVEVAVVGLASQFTPMVRTDAAGAFALRELPPQQFRCVLHHPGFLPANVPVDAATPQPLRLVLQRAPVVRGRIVDADDRPVASFCVALVAAGDEARPAPVQPPPDATWQQRDDGCFELRAEGAGAHDLQVFTPRGRPAQRRLQLAADAVVDELVRIDAGVSARGVVRDADGDPVALAMVRVQFADGREVQATTGADGVFALPPQAPGAVALTIEPQDGPVLQRADLQLDLAGPAPFFDLQLPRGAAAAGSVLPWQQGQQGRVLFAHASGAVRRAEVDAATGSFAIAELTPGTHAVWVERLEPVWRHRVARLLFERATAPTVELVAGTTVRCDVADISATMARVRGRVAGHQAPERLTVRAFAEARPLPERALGLLRASPAADGTFELDGLLPGRWRLQATLGDAVVGWDTVDLGAAADVEFVLRLGDQRR